MYVRILNTGQLIDLQRRLRSAGNENLRRNMQRRVRRAAEPFQRDVKQGFATNPIRGAGRTVSGGPTPTHRPLRAAVANSIRISVRTTGAGVGARVWIDRSALPSDFKNAPEKINYWREWRHPVFDNRSAWTPMYAKEVWAPNLRKHLPRMQVEVARCLNDVRNALS